MHSLSSQREVLECDGHNIMVDMMDIKIYDVCGMNMLQET